MVRTALKCLLGVGLVVLIAAFAINYSPTVVEAVTPDVGLLGVFGQDSDGVLFVDFASLRDIEFLSNFIADQVEGQIPGPVEEFTLQTGLDPVNDIEQIMIGRDGPEDFLVAIRASYDEDRVSDYFDGMDVMSEVYSNRTIYLPNTEDSDWAVVFADGQILLGSEDAVRGSLDRRLAGPTALDNPELMADIQAIEEGNQVWGVGTFSDMVPNGFAPPMATDLIAVLEHVSYQMRVDVGVSAKLAGDFTTSDTARRAGDLLRGVVALGKMGSAQQPDMIQLLDGVQVENLENSVEISFSATQELIDRITESGAIPFPLN
jgi:hypothetical protein